MSVETSILPLAGIFQVTELVRQIARQGVVETISFETSLKSILKVNADSTAEVYGGIQGVELGLNLICQLFDKRYSRQRPSTDLARYVFGLIFLEGKLRKQPTMLKQISTGIEHITQMTETYPINHSLVIAEFAQLYVDTLSLFEYRIQINGEQNLLRDPHNVNKIRALLLAGIRSAVLWRQRGGSRLHLLLYRKRIVQTAKDFLAQINTSTE
jgi:high frequency lysogenization protein